MARFCMSCGSPLEENLRFCPQCGATVVALPATPQAAAPVAARPAPAAAAAPRAPAAAVAAKKSSPVVKILLIVLGIFTFATVLGMGTCVYIGYRAKREIDKAVKLDSSGGSITINTPEGPLRLGQRQGDPNKPVGSVPPYPGAKAVDAGGEFSLGGQGGISGQEFETADPVDKVVAFYKEKLGPNLSVVENEGRFRLAVSDQKAESVTTIDVYREEDGGKTKIFIAHIGK